MRVNGRVAEAYWNQVPGSWDNSGQGTEWTLPCDTTPPDLVLHIGSGTAVIPGHLLNTGIVNGPSKSLINLTPMLCLLSLAGCLDLLINLFSLRVYRGSDSGSR